MLYTQVSLFVVLNLGTSAKGAVIQQSDLWVIAITLSCLWLLAIVLLLIFSEKGFKRTFYQPLRAWEYNRALFDTGVDEYRMFIFDDHREYYLWYRDLVEEWLVEVWDELHQQKPAWFTDEVIKRIPLEFIPHIHHESVREEMHGERERRRKSSAFVISEALGGVVGVSDTSTIG